MADKLVFAIQQYAWLALFGVAFWGLGTSAMVLCVRRASPDRWIADGLAALLGLGLYTVVFQWLALAGGLRRFNVGMVLLLGCVLAAAQLYQAYRRRSPGTQQPAAPWQQRLYLLPPLVLAIPTLLAVLQPPHRWDEVMYHLPHAQQWVQSGHLQVNEWLRFPWSPFNLGLLTAAGLIVNGDVLPHLLQGLTGWLTAVLVFRVALPHGGRLAACLAAGIWLFASRTEYGSAYVDMGISAFVFGACTTFMRWLDDRADRGWLVLSGLLLGCALGSKYHALGFLPLFSVCALLFRPRLGNLLIWAAAVALPCVYWYARNLMATGNPFNPLGASVFGYFDWNAADIQAAFEDIGRNADWPPTLLWPAALAPLFPTARKRPALRFLLAFALYGFVVWIVTSHYSRYLLPVYPVLAILSAYVLVEGAAVVTKRWRSTSAQTSAGLRAWQVGIVGVLTLASIGSIVGKTHRNWIDIALTELERERVIRPSVWSYGMAQKLKGQDLGKIYQLGMEGTLYYLPPATYGDHFGPWRYGNLHGLPARAIAEKLSTQGFSTLLLVSTVVAAHESKPDFSRYFSVITESDGDKAYAIRADQLAQP